MMTAKQKYRSTEKGKSTEKAYNQSTGYAAQKKWMKSPSGKIYQRQKNKRQLEYRKEWLNQKYKTDPEFRKKVLARSKKFRDSEKGKKYYKHFALNRNFGITLGDYNKLARQQKFKCACCFKNESILNKKLYVDHCHETGKIRGLLCQACNAGIGLLGDRIESVEMALIYLKKAYSQSLKEK